MYAKHYVRAATALWNPEVSCGSGLILPPFPTTPLGLRLPSPWASHWPARPSRAAGVEWEEGRVMFTVLLAPFVVASWSQMGVLNWGPDPAPPPKKRSVDRIQGV